MIRFGSGAGAASLAGLTGLGTGVGTALGTNIGSAGAPVLFNGAGGTPSSLTLTNATGLPNASVIGLGTAALKATGTSGNTVPLLDGTNTWTNTQTIPTVVTGSTPGARLGFNFINLNATGTMNWTNSSDATGTNDLIVGRDAAATLRLGSTDAAAPVAQTICVQDVVAGTSNTAGVNTTIQGSRGTGTGAGGSIIFQTAPAGSTGSTQNALASTLTISPTAITPIVPLDLSGAAAGQIVFPASQNASSNANTLDDYEEGTWTPVLTFASNTDLTVAYTTQLGGYIKIGKLVYAWFNINAGTFTFTTSSGALQITGLPFNSDATTNYTAKGTLDFQGVTLANYTQFTPNLAASANIITIIASGQGQTRTTTTATHWTTASTKILIGGIAYVAAT